MSDLRDLYQEVILDHNKRPRNFHEMGSADLSAQGYNPLCGDKVTIYVQVEDDVIKDVSFCGSGCAISTASASLLTEAIKGKHLRDARETFERFRALVTGSPEDEHAPLEDPLLGELVVFSGICKFPMRVKCATLAWHTLAAALNRGKETVTTE